MILLRSDHNLCCGNHRMARTPSYPPLFFSKETNLLPQLPSPEHGGNSRNGAVFTNQFDMDVMWQSVAGPSGANTQNRPHAGCRRDEDRGPQFVHTGLIQQWQVVRQGTTLSLTIVTSICVRAQTSHQCLMTGGEHPSNFTTVGSWLQRPEEEVKVWTGREELWMCVSGGSW